MVSIATGIGVFIFGAVAAAVLVSATEVWNIAATATSRHFRILTDVVARSGSS